MHREGGTNGACVAASMDPSLAIAVDGGLVGVTSFSRSLEEIQVRWVLGGDRMIDAEAA